MGLNLFTQIIAWLALIFAMLAFAWRLRVFNQLARPKDQVPPKGSARAGIIYAFTLGMAPWAKESTRNHWIAYMRGVSLHVGIFLGLAVFILKPWLPEQLGAWQNVLSLVLAVGAFLGLAGFLARIVEPNLRALSTPDDYFAVLVVSLFLSAESLWLSGWLPAPAFYLLSTGMLVYAPFSKIRHCIYYAYSRLFFGRFVGVRSVLPHSSQQSAR